MSRIPRWILWMSLALAVWIGWGFTALPTFQSRESELNDERARLEEETEKAMSLLAGMPALMAHIDSLDSEFHETTASFVRTADIEAWLERIRTAGVDRGLRRTVVVPELESLLEAAHSTTPTGGEICKTGPLLVELTASGGFAPIGRWLDEIERRADFQYWNACRWESGDGNGLIRFAGRATFWFVGPERPDQTQATS